MSGLVLKLSPKERVLINGAVLENGDRRTKLNIVTANANVLRLKDAIHPDRANTPVGRICYDLQLILCGEASLDALRAQVDRGIRQLMEIFRGAQSQQLLEQSVEALSQDNPYKSLKLMRRLLPLEAQLLGMIEK